MTNVKLYESYRSQKLESLLKAGEPQTDKNPLAALEDQHFEHVEKVEIMKQVKEFCVLKMKQIISKG